ncbi:hypothetical protein NHX12_007853 [Muraenolepis orangiensis]|uniref:Phospholipase A1 member A n=1 Tax=Muraenolepis orangiensis TaxID=630683 RepID=A0A9Q0DS81_9TELE|nr:hypothetical protein NHX12_007853 [Muraenolepis orangiensis]
MAKSLTAVHVCLALVLRVVVLGVEVERRDECAYLNKTTFLEYKERHPLQVQVLGSRPAWVENLARAVLRAEDSNVLVVDWVYGASFAYNLVVDIYKEVALQISILINKLQNQGCQLESFHLIGVSLGAHVAGFVGTIFEGKIGRITGLDPAGPMFKNADLFNRLDPSDALFVEAIHTDSDYFGISIPVGHVDFFLNGGMDQVGCTRSRFPSIYGYVICDHMRALYVYISALSGSCPLTGIPCPAYEDFLQGRCLSCNGPCPTIGLLKNSAYQVLLEIRVSQLKKSAELEVTLRKDINTTDHKFLLVLALPSPLCQLVSIQLKSTGARFYRQGDLHVETVCITPIPAARPEEALCVKNFDVHRGMTWSHDYVQVCDDY